MPPKLMPPKLFDTLNLEAISKAVYSWCTDISRSEPETMKDEEEQPMPPFDNDGNVIAYNSFTYKHDPSRIIVPQATVNIDCDGDHKPLVPDCSVWLDEPIMTIRKDNFMNKKFNTDTAEPMTDIGKEVLVKNQLRVFFNGKNVIFKLCLGVTIENVRRYELPMEANSCKFEAFCHGMVRFYNEILKDKFRDDIHVSSTYCNPETRKTTVTFTDGSEVSCVPEKDETGIFEKYGNYFGQDICFCKKIFGSSGAIRRILNVCDAAAASKAKKERLKKMCKELDADKRRREQESRERAFKSAVEQKMREILVEREALRRIEEAHARKGVDIR